MGSRRHFRTLFLVLPLVIMMFQFHNAAASVQIGSLFADPPIISSLPINTTFSINVRVASMSYFTAWDIQVYSNQSVINATSLSIVGNVFGANGLPTLPVSQCVNGVGSCFPFVGDGPGVVHSAVVISVPGNVTGDGLLFSITYKVVGLGSSRISFQLYEIIDAYTHTLDIPHTTTGATYGPPLPDFALSTSQPDITVIQNQSLTTIINLTSTNGFSGALTMSSKGSIGSSSDPISGLQMSFNPSTVSLSAQAQNKTTLEISTNSTTPQALITILVTGKSGLISEFTIVRLHVVPPGDFVLSARPSLLLLHAAQSGNSTIMLQSQRFSGTVQLTVTAQDSFGQNVSGLSAKLGVSTFSLSSEGSGVSESTTMTVFTPPANITFSYIVTVNATGGGQFHSIQIFVRPPQPDFGFTVTPIWQKTTAGSTNTVTITLSSHDYYRGTIYLFAAPTSGAKMTFTNSTVFLDYGNTKQTKLTISLDPTISGGAHVITLTATGALVTISGPTPLTHMQRMTLSLPYTNSPMSNAAPAPKTIFGLNPLVYFGVIAALAIVMALMTIREARKGRNSSVYLGPTGREPNDGFSNPSLGQ